MAQEKLIVKNFGPIKDAEIELGKVTVFIGEQASGKSVLAKLVAICSDFNNLIYFSDKVLENYSIKSFKNDKTYIKFVTENFSLLINGHDSVVNFYNPVLKNVLSNFNEVRDILIHGRFSNEEQLEYPRQDFKLLQRELEELNSKISETLKSPIYIPTERILVALISKSPFSLYRNQAPSLPNYMVDFGLEFGSYRFQEENFKIPFLDIDYQFKENYHLVILPSGQRISLSEASSGFQSIIPLYVVTEKQSEIGSKLLIIEEPELNLYPTTQKKLVEYLAGKTDKNSLILTTHSPYILSSLDNLIQAGNVVKKHPELAAEVEKIIPAQYHLNYEDVKVYFVADGKARLIMNEEYQGIDVNELDTVSENLNEEFEKLLELKYQD